MFRLAFSQAGSNKRHSPPRSSRTIKETRVGWVRPTAAPLRIDLADAQGLQAFEKIARLQRIVMRIGSFDTQEKAIARCGRKTGIVKDRVVEPGQSATQQHPEKYGQGGAQYRHVERGRNQTGPGRRAPTDVQGIVDGDAPPLQGEDANPAEDTADECQPRQPLVGGSQRFDQALDPHRCVRLELPIASAMCGARRLQQGPRAGKLGKQAVRRFGGFHEAPCWWVSNSRISHMEIKGTKRTKSSSIQPKKPIEPTSIVQSQMVG